MHFYVPSGLYGDLDTALRAHIKANMWQMVSDSFVLDSWDLTKLDGTNLTRLYGSPGTGDFRGQATGDYIPNASALIKHLTATGGRSGRGRTYLPALGESRQTNGQTAATQRALTTTAWGQFLTDMNGNTPQIFPCIASYTHGTFAAIAASTCEVSIATQRRRLKR